MIWMICILSLSHGLTNIRSKTPTIFFPLVENCIVFLMFFLQTLASRVQACACACAFIIRPCLSYECCPFRIFRDESLTFEYLRRYIYYNIYTIPHPFLSIPSCRCEGTLHSVTFTWNWKRMNRYLMTCFNSQVCWHGTNCALSISVSYLFFLCLSLSVVFASDFYLSHLCYPIHASFPRYSLALALPFTYTRFLPPSLNNQLIWASVTLPHPLLLDFLFVL